MQTTQYDTLELLLHPILGRRRTQSLLETLELPHVVSPASDSGSPRAQRVEIALALVALLFDDILERVPEARAYVADLTRTGRRLLLDHGALRTVMAPCGELPQGRWAFERILVPLGYRVTETYALDGIGMTGYAYTQVDLPESAPQYFVSELHPERFSAAFQVAALRVFSTSTDPLASEVLAELEELRQRQSLEVERAARLLPELVACFGRQHDLPRLEDYEILRAESAEMAWIATEGQVFNHATDRVEDVAHVAREQGLLGRPIKDQLETSKSGRVIQTAFRAAPVERLFVGAAGELITRSVPGSFHEFIQRGRLSDGRLDLAFDPGNAQGIFAMTRVPVDGDAA